MHHPPDFPAVHRSSDGPLCAVVLLTSATEDSRPEDRNRNQLVNYYTALYPPVRSYILRSCVIILLFLLHVVAKLEQRIFAIAGDCVRLADAESAIATYSRPGHHVLVVAGFKRK